MTWTPQFQIVRTNLIADNLLAFIMANQADAILWANGTPIRPLKQLTSSIQNRTAPVFPSISLVNTEDDQIFGNDLIEGAYELALEINVESADPATALSEANIYDAAVKSMILNMPSATLSANTGITSNNAMVHEIKSRFSEQTTNDQKNDFFQTLQITTTFMFSASVLD